MIENTQPLQMSSYPQMRSDKLLSTLKKFNPKVNQLWILIGRTDAEVEAPILWPPNTKSHLIGKEPDAGKDWRIFPSIREIDNEMVGWHHWLNGHKFESTPGVGRPGMLQSIRLQRVRHDWETELNWTELINERCWASFRVFVDHLYVFFGEMSV